MLYTHAGPEVAVASTKGYLTQIVACYLVGLYLAQVRGTKYGDEIAQGRRRPAGDAGEDGRRCWRDLEPVRELARELRRRDLGALPRPARRLPDGARGRAQAQGARLHARRGLRRRRAQARPDRADRGRRAGHRRRCRRRAAAASCTTRSCPTSRRSGPAVRAPSSSPRRATPTSSRTPTSSSGSREAPTLLQPLLSTIPLQVFACEMAKVRGHDVDQPRNLAKSVTVE